MKVTKKSKLKLMGRMASFARHLLPQLGLAVFFAVSGFLVTLAIPALLLSTGLNLLAGQPLDTSLLFLLVLLGLFRGVSRYGEHYFGHYVAFHVLADFRREIFAKLRRLAPARLDQQDSGALLKLIGEDVEALEVFFAHSLPPLATGFLSGLILLLYFSSFSLLAAFWALLVYLSLALVLPRALGRRMEPLVRAQGAMRRSYTSSFLEVLRGMKDLIQLGKDQEALEALNEKSQAVNGQERNISRLNLLQASLSFLVLGLGVLVFAAWAWYLIGIGARTYQQGLLMTVVFSYSFAPFLELGRLPLGLGRALQAGQQTFDLLDEEEPAQAEGLVLDRIEGVDIEDLGFAYEDRGPRILEDVQASFHGQQVIGILGASGSGKSTLMKLMMKWYPPSQGHIYLDGLDLAQVDGRQLQKRIAYIPQKPQIFSQSIRDNLLLGRTGIDDDEILDLAQACQMKEKILGTENGLDTRLDSEKPIFSSGEMQRLELIRAFLKQADIYIFDEPTSNLDSLNEALIVNIIRDSCPGLVFLISHRRSTLAGADQLYQVKEGRLAAMDFTGLGGDLHEKNF